jgi:hypothetical protein
MAAGILDELVSDGDQRQIAECLARVIGQKWGQVRLIVENGKLKFITAEQSYNSVGQGAPHTQPPAAPSSP